MNPARKKHRVLLPLLLVLLGVPLAAVAEKDGTTEFDAIIGDSNEPVSEVMYGEEVDRIYAPRISSWRVLDDQRIILYATPFKPYLITLNRRASGLRFDDTIVIKRNGSTIHARFDSIIVDGFPYNIKRIEKLDKETAKSLLAVERDKKRKGANEDDEGGKKQESEDSSDS